MMNKKVLFFALLVALLSAACGPKATPTPEGLTPPTGEVILAVSGDIGTPNAGDLCQFDAALLDRFAIEQTIDDPWMGDGLVYQGVTLLKIWELCGAAADAQAATLVATDGMEVVIAAEDLRAWPIMLAYQVDGADLVEETGGPVKLVFPAEARGTYADEQWMWWVTEVKIGGEESD
jgi:hypothetical protein